MKIPSIEERFEQTSVALNILSRDYPESGLIDPTSGGSLTRLSDLELSPFEYAAVRSICGDSMPEAKPNPQDQSSHTPVSIEDLEDTYGITNPFGLVAVALRKSLELIFIDNEWANPEGKILYANGRDVKNLGGALGGGAAVMGMMLSQIAANLHTTPNSIQEYSEVADKSLPTLPIPVANLPAEENTELEFLYQLRVSPNFSPDRAAQALGIANAEKYVIRLNPETGKAELASWSTAKPSLPDGHPRCLGLSHKVFGRTWRHMIKATCAFPELFLHTQEALPTRTA